jgi:hypothetical protein
MTVEQLVSNSAAIRLPNLGDSIQSRADFQLVIARSAA